jgi:UDP-2,4-diacetamido-2,4,6-trideoxy-beta-L-altropyranose hydrolase
MNTVLFRADGNANIGAGHIMRCFALAQAVKDSGGSPVFLSSDLAEGFIERIGNDTKLINLKADAYSKNDIEETAKTAKEIGATWVVLDGYDFDEEYEKALQATGVRVLRLDDHSHLSGYTADIILNQNAHAKADQYLSIGTDTNLLLGNRYTMLQRPFRDSTPQGDVPGTAKNILITLGGSDPDNLTPMVIRSLKGLDVTLTIIIGGGNSNGDDVHKAVEETGLPSEVIVNASNMHELMQTADMAITAAGSTCYELAYMGVPMLCIIVADNQVGVAEGLSTYSAAINLGWKTEVTEESLHSAVSALIDDPATRQKLQTAGKELIDGQGAFRVLMHMNDSSLHLRTAQDVDCRMIFEWANDPDTRAASFSSEPIPWEDHTKWFATKLADPLHKFYVALNADNEPLGQVRFDCTEDTATISVSVAPLMRGKKYATPLVVEGCQRLFGETKVNTIDAYIKPENAASTAVFTKAGFSESDQTQQDDDNALHFILTRDE